MNSFIQPKLKEICCIVLALLSSKALAAVYIPESFNLKDSYATNTSMVIHNLIFDINSKFPVVTDELFKDLFEIQSGYTLIMAENFFYPYSINKNENFCSINNSILVVDTSFTNKNNAIKNCNIAHTTGMNAYFTAGEFSGTIFAQAKSNTINLGAANKVIFDGEINTIILEPEVKVASISLLSGKNEIRVNANSVHNAVETLELHIYPGATLYNPGSWDKLPKTNLYFHENFLSDAPLNFVNKIFLDGQSFIFDLSHIKTTQPIEITSKTQASLIDANNLLAPIQNSGLLTITGQNEVKSYSQTSSGTLIFALTQDLKTSGKLKVTENGFFRGKILILSTEPITHLGEEIVLIEAENLNIQPENLTLDPSIPAILKIKGNKVVLIPYQVLYPTGTLAPIEEKKTPVPTTSLTPMILSQAPTKILLTPHDVLADALEYSKRGSYDKLEPFLVSVDLTEPVFNFNTQSFKAIAYNLEHKNFLIQYFAVQAPSIDPQGFWLKSFGGVSSFTDKTKHLSNYNTLGFGVGYDFFYSPTATLNNSIVLGAAFSTANSALRHAFIQGTNQYLQGAIYTSFTKHAFSINVICALSFNQHLIQHAITTSLGVLNTHGAYRSKLISAELNGSYNIKLNKNLNVSPLVVVHGNYLIPDHYTDNIQRHFNLSNTMQVKLGVGAKIAYHLPTNFSDIIFALRSLVTYDFNSDNKSTVYFQDFPAHALTLKTTHHPINITIGCSTILLFSHNMQLNLAYELQTKPSITHINHEFSLSLRYNY